MHEELLRQAVGLEYQALAVAAGPLTSLATGWLLRQLALHLRDRRAADCAARLVAWAQQAIPDKGARYTEVAALLSRRFPLLSGEQVEVLIESEVLGLKAALRASTRDVSVQATAAGMATNGTETAGAAAIVTTTGAAAAGAAAAGATPGVSTPGAEAAPQAALRVGAV